jgi:hypothetical protein
MLPFCLKSQVILLLCKTTLVKLVYDDGRIEGHFDLGIWECVCVDFSIKGLTIVIIESILGTSPNVQQFDNQHIHQIEKLGGKKFLLMLDDVWDDDMITAAN